MISINYRDNRPIYEQIADSLRTQILKGIIKPDDKLPSVREIATELSINPNTIQRAFRLLEQEGYIYTVLGRGSFAAEFNHKESPRKEELLMNIDATVKELMLYGITENELWMRIERTLKGGNKDD